MEIKQLQSFYYEIRALRDEFQQKWRKKDFRFIKERDANEKRVGEIIYSVAQIIQNNSYLENLIFENKDENYKEHIRLRGFSVKNNFLSYVNPLLSKLEDKLE